MITYDLSILNQKGTPMFYSDLTANRPAFGIVGRIFIATDSPYGIFRDTGSAWDQISSAGGGATIYTGDGTLLGNRIVTSGGYNLTYSNDGLAQYASVPSGLKIINNTASSGGINQYSPPIIMSGAGWNFGGSTPISIRQYLKTLSAIPANPIWQLESSINNGAYTPLLRAYTNGTISGLMIGSSSQIADAQIAATGKTSLLVAGDIRTFGGYQYDIGLISSNGGSYLQSYTNGGASPLQSLFFSYYTTTFNQQDIIFSGGTTSSKYFGYSTGNWTIGGVVDAGFKCDIQGTARINGNTTINGDLLQNGNIYVSGSGGNKMIRLTDYYTILRLQGTSSVGDFNLQKGFGYSLIQSPNEGIVYDAPSNLFGAYVGSGAKLQVTNTSADAHLLVWGASAPSIRLDNNYTGATQRFAIGLSTATNNFIQGSVTGDICITSAASSSKPILFGIWDTIDAVEAGRFSASRNFLLGSIVDTGEKLQVNGTAKVTGTTTITNGHLLINGGSGYVIGLNGTTNTPRITTNGSNIQLQPGGNGLLFLDGSQSYFTAFNTRITAASRKNIYDVTANDFSGNNNLNDFTTAFSGSLGTNTFNHIALTPTGSPTSGTPNYRGIYINTIQTGFGFIRAIESVVGGAYFNTTSVAASAILQADSVTQGFLPPRMTQAQILAIATPANGLIVYNTDLAHICFYDGTAWKKVSNSAM